MTIGWQEQLQTRGTLQEIVQQATEALIRMDSERLEELAQCCADLNREIQQSGQDTQVLNEERILRDEVQDSAYDMQLFERILFETRANLTVFSRLHVMRLREVGLLAEGSSLYSADAIRGQSAQERKVAYGDN